MFPYDTLELIGKYIVGGVIAIIIAKIVITKIIDFIKHH